jgi:14-3-3 protein epsilon
MTTSREDALWMARVCQKAELYEDMILHLKKALKFAIPFTLAERTLLSSAYKHSASRLRNAWRSVITSETEEEIKSSLPRLATLRDYKSTIEKNLFNLCHEIINFLDTNLIPQSTTDLEACIYYQKMKADYYRYIAEFATGEAYNKAADNAVQAYMNSLDTASGKLKKTDPVLLGCA